MNDTWIQLITAGIVVIPVIGSIWQAGKKLAAIGVEARESTAALIRIESDLKQTNLSISMLFKTQAEHGERLADITARMKDEP